MLFFFEYQTTIKMQLFGVISFLSFIKLSVGNGFSRLTSCYNQVRLEKIKYMDAVENLNDSKEKQA